MNVVYFQDPDAEFLFTLGTPAFLVLKAKSLKENVRSGPELLETKSLH